MSVCLHASVPIHVTHATFVQISKSERPIVLRPLKKCRSTRAAKSRQEDSQMGEIAREASLLKP